MLGRTIPLFPGRCAEWNSAGGIIARAAMEVGVPVEHLYPRHTSVVEWVIRKCEFPPYTGGEIALLGGSAQTEGEIDQFEWVTQTYQPRIAVIIVPL